MHFEFLDDHQRSTHMKNPTKKKPRYNSAANNAVQNSSSQGSHSSSGNGLGPPQLTYYSVVKCSKPFSELIAISQASTPVQSWIGQDGLGSAASSQEISPMGSYPYHHTANKRGRGRGSSGVSGQNNRFSPNTLMALQNGTTTEPDANGQYKCHFDECFFNADTKDRLEFHLFAHRSSRFKCPYCPYVSNVLNDIKRHIIKGGKHDGPMFSCPNDLCDFATNCDKAFRDHIRLIHFGKQIDDKSLTDYIEEMFVNTRTEEPLGTS